MYHSNLGLLVIKKTRRSVEDVRGLGAFQQSEERLCVLLGAKRLGFKVSGFWSRFSRFESLILSHHSRFNDTCECNDEEINDDPPLPGGLVEDVRGLGAFQQSEERLCVLFGVKRLLFRNVKRFRGGLVFKAHRLVYLFKAHGLVGDSLRMPEASERSSSRRSASASCLG